MNIYLAGSWRTGGARLDLAAAALARAGHEVFDFRVGAAQLWWEREPAVAPYQRDRIESGEARDRWRPCRSALDAADAIVLVEPAGRSAHMEAGYVAGRGRPVLVWLLSGERPDLALLLAAHRCVSLDHVIDRLRLACDTDAAGAAP